MPTHASCYLFPRGVSISVLRRLLGSADLVMGPPRSVESTSDVNRLLGSAVFLPVNLRGVSGIPFLGRLLGSKDHLRQCLWLHSLSTANTQAFRAKS